jgi:hypothetical protein
VQHIPHARRYLAITLLRWYKLCTQNRQGCSSPSYFLNKDAVPKLGGTVQEEVAACISPAEVLEASSGQLPKVGYLVRRVAGLYVTSDPWSLMTCVVAETPSKIWTLYPWSISLNVAFLPQVRSAPFSLVNPR